MSLSKTATQPAAAALRNRTRGVLHNAAILPSSSPWNIRPKPVPQRSTASRTASAPRWHGTATNASKAALAPNPMPEIHEADSYDIVIIGGGPAGLALACTLLSKPSIASTTRVLLIEGGSLDRVRQWNASGNDQWDNRVSSLTAENVGFLKDIGAWGHVDTSRSCEVREMLVWTSTSSSASKSTSQIHFPQLSSPMAHLTENINTQRGLLRRISELNQASTSDGNRITISEGRKVLEMKAGEGGRWVGLRLSGEKPKGPDGVDVEGDGTWVRGGVIVGADGYNSPVRTFSNIPSFGHAYNTHAVVATLHHQPVFDNHTAFQRFLNTGPIAFLPLGPEASTLVWSTSPELAAAYKKLDVVTLAKLVNLGFYLSEPELDAINARILSVSADDTNIADSISTALDTALTSLTSTDLHSLPPLTTSIPPRSIASFPLKLSHAESYIGERTVLVGDAAHTVHPLAGQGLNMGLADVRCLGDVWERTAQRGGDLGAYTALLPYSKERYPANHTLLSATDKMHHLFRNRLPIVNWARAVGMDLVNELGPVKKALMENAGAKANLNQHSEGRTGRYGSAASGFEGWLQVKGMAGLVAGAGGEIVKNGARRLLERIAK